MRELTATLIASAFIAAAVLAVNYWALARASDAVQLLMRATG
jgi:hypothetical protein